jgi:hypothetical protein
MTLSPDGEVFKSNFFIIDSPPLCSPRGIRVLIPQGERAIKLINARLHGEYGSSVFDALAPWSRSGRLPWRRATAYFTGRAPNPKHCRRCAAPTQPEAYHQFTG